MTKIPALKCVFLLKKSWVLSHINGHTLQKTWQLELFFQSIFKAKKCPAGKKRTPFMKHTFQWQLLVQSSLCEKSFLIISKHFFLYIIKTSLVTKSWIYWIFQLFKPIISSFSSSSNIISEQVLIWSFSNTPYFLS